MQKCPFTNSKESKYLFFYMQVMIKVAKISIYLDSRKTCWPQLQTTLNLIIHCVNKQFHIHETIVKEGINGVSEALFEIFFKENKLVKSMLRELKKKKKWKCILQHLMWKTIHNLFSQILLLFQMTDVIFTWT